MNIIDIIFIAVSVSIDALAVSVCKGLSINKVSVKYMLCCGLWFGIFQALMPVIGYFIGEQLYSLIQNFSMLVAGGILFLVGANMIRVAIKNKDNGELDSNIGIISMFLLAIATSIDALFVGFSFSCMHIDILCPAITFGITTFLFSFFGAGIGSLIGNKFRFAAEISGGVILIFLSIKTILCQYNLIAFM